MNRSLKHRLRFYLCAAIAGLFLLVGLILNFAVKKTLYSEFDFQLKQSCMSLGHLVETDGYEIESELEDGEWPQFTRTTNPEYYEILDFEGNQVECSSNLDGNSLSHVLQSREDVRFEDRQLPDGISGRICSVALIPSFDEEGMEPEPEDPAEDLKEYASARKGAPLLKGQPVTISIGRSTKHIETMLSRLRWVIAITTLVGLGLGLLMTEWVVTRGLSPLRSTVEQLSQIDAKNFQTQISPDQSPTEIQPLVTELNGVLSRLSDSIERERQFSSNIAHELRTPVAGLKSTIEVAISRPRENSEYSEALRKCMAICTQTEAVLENMLTLGRVESDRIEVSENEIDVTQVLNSVVAIFNTKAEGNKNTLDVQLDGRSKLVTDEAKFRLIARNLIDNAISYSPKLTGIRIRSENCDDRYSLSVTNSTENTDRIMTDKWFDRFWRDDDARTHTGIHCGIGLSLSQTIAQLMGGDLTAEIEGNQVTMVFTLNGNTKDL